MTFWKPIADAPKDGTRLLLRINGYAIEAFWNTGDEFWDVLVLPSHGCGCCGTRDPDPTHFATLPNLEK